MTRFEREIAGLHGDFWKRDAERRVAGVAERYNEGILLIEEDGAAMWSKSGNYVPEEYVEYAIYAGLPVNAEATKAKRDMQTGVFLTRYRKESRPINPEALYEMRAAFGTGRTVVDVIAGERINL